MVFKNLYRSSLCTSVSQFVNTEVQFNESPNIFLCMCSTADSVFSSPDSYEKEWKLVFIGKTRNDVTGVLLGQWGIFFKNLYSMNSNALFGTHVKVDSSMYHHATMVRNGKIQSICIKALFGIQFDVFKWIINTCCCCCDLVPTSYGLMVSASDF